MSKEPLNTKDDVLGLLYLIQQIRKDYEAEFAISLKNGCNHLVDIIEKSKTVEKISLPTLERVFNFQKRPKISHATMNKIVQWYTEKKYNVFSAYVKDNIRSIRSSNLISEKELDKVLEEIKKGKVEGDDVKKGETINVLAENNNNIIIKNILDNRIGNRWILFSVFFVAVLLFLVFSDLLPIRSKEDKTSSTTNYHIENVFVSDSNRIFPDGQTQFFGDDGRPKVWYTNYNGKLEFYDTLGIHPKNKEPLQPVTEEVIKIYLSDSEKEEETSKKPESNSPIAQNSILVRIFDKDYGQETETTSYLSQLLAENYTITSSNNLVLEEKDIENALNGEIGGIQNELGKKVRFLCIGKIDFSFGDSPDRESWRKCTLSLHYSITDLKTGQIVNSNHKTFYGLGSSDTSAKTNTIKKIAL